MITSPFSKREIFVVIPVHNREPITVRCLQTLKEQGVFDLCQIVVVNDGSTDQTRETVAFAYPEVIILDGDGSLYWTGAIKMGMQYALQKGAKSIIWLNDDCLPGSATVSTMLAQAEERPDTILGAQSYELDGTTFSYSGGVVRGGDMVKQTVNRGQVLKCEWLHGNLVLIPRAVVAKIGLPDAKRFPHYHGDSTYTHYAYRNGVELAIVGDCVAYCADSSHVYSRFFATEPISSFIKSHFSLKSGRYWRAALGLELEMCGLNGYLRFMRYLLSSILILGLRSITPSPIRNALRPLNKLRD